MLRISFFALLTFMSFTYLSAQEAEERELRDKIKPFPNFVFLPDLTVTNITRPAYNGSTYISYVTVQNIGRRLAPSFYVLMRDNYTGAGRNVYVDSLASRQSTTLSFTLSPPENQGPWYISAIADYGNKVRESNEGNNSKTLYTP